MSGQLKQMVQIGTPRLVQVCMHVCMMVIDLSVPGAHEPLKVAKEREVVVLHTSQNLPYTARGHYVKVRETNWRLCGTAKVFHIRYDCKA